MADPVIEEYLASAIVGTHITLTTGVGTQVGWWLLAVQSWDFYSVSGMTAPVDGETWRRIGSADAGTDKPHTVVWAREVTTGGANAVQFLTGLGPGLPGQADNHARLYVLSGVREYQAFRLRASSSNELATANTAEQSYAPDDDALLIAVWCATDGTTTNYTLPASLTAQTELDGSFSTSRSGYKALSAAGPTGALTATAADASYYAAVQIIVSGSQGAITFPATQLSFRVELALGADLRDHPDDWEFTDISAYVFYRDEIAIREGRADESGRVEPGSCALTLDNIISGTQGGRFSTRNPLSPYFGLLRINTPIRVWVDPGSGFADLFSGFVPSWSPQWTTGGNRYIRITAKGFLYLPGQGTPPEYSAMTRTVLGSSDNLLAFWPCEDGADATDALSALRGGGPMITSGTVVFADSDPFTGFGGSIHRPHDPLPNLNAGGVLTGDVPPGASSPVAWAVQFVSDQDPGTGAGETVILCEWHTPGGTYAKWRIQQTDPSGDTDVIGITAAGASTTVLQLAEQFPSWDVHRVDAVQDGADVDVRLWIGGELKDSATLVTNTLTHVRRVIANPAGNSITPDWWMGEIQVFDTNDTGLAPLLVDLPVDGYGLTYFPTFAYWKETATDRLVRLAEDDGVLLDIPPTELRHVTRMDSQPVGAQLDLYRQSEATDGGVLYERGFALGYLPRAARYNPPVSLAIDYAQGHLLDLQPTDDDQRTRNRATVPRAFGSRGVAEDLDGPNGVNTVGPYETTLSTLNIFREEDLNDRASWELRGFTVDEYRYPVVSLDFGRADAVELIPGWLDMPTQGGRLSIANPPDDVPPETIDLIREGYTQRLTQVTWTAELNCSPAAPWLVWTPESEDGGNAGRVGTSGHTVATDISSSSTTLPVVRGALVRKGWDAVDVPYDLEVIPAGWTAGERVTVTAVADATFSTVAAGAAAHAVNDSVTPALPGHAARDALYVFAAIRNSGAGVPFTESAGWERLEIFPTDSNAQVFGKIAESAAETDPVIQFSGGVANADTTAQAWRARAGTLELVAAAAQLNASAANIATPAVTWTPGNRGSLLALYFGWKQDDWTSVAVHTGSEIGEPDTTTGDDQGIVWNRDATTVDDGAIAAGSFVVTGGANAISRGAVAVFRIIDQNLTVTRSVNGAVLAHTPGAAVKLWRPRHLAL